jgi:prepilin signal peptidase PulO-like enzyme (type II secretory pathway)
VLTYYLLFVAEARVGAEQLTWRTDLPFLLAWLVLVAVLIGCAALDLISYVVDTRVTNVALIGGVVLCALWPRAEFFAPRAASPIAAATVVAFLVSVLMLWLTARQEVASKEPESPQTNGGAARAGATASLVTVNVTTIVAVVVFIALVLYLLAATGKPMLAASGPGRFVVPVTLLALFVTMVMVGGQARAADAELRATIEAEAPEARGMILREMLWLTPVVVAAVAAYFVVRHVPAVAFGWRSAVGWMPLGQWTPLAGAAFAVHGAIVAAAAGWIIRILFTLVFGREAFGVGDIYLLAAAGAVGGWDVALLGFLLSVPIALLGWALSLLLKRTGMIPFGPPLALGFLVALWVNRPAAATTESYYADLKLAWQQRPNMVLLGVGMLLVVLPLAVVIARLTRRLVEPAEAPVAVGEPPVEPAEGPVQAEDSSGEPQSESSEPTEPSDDR